MTSSKITSSSKNQKRNKDILKIHNLLQDLIQDLQDPSSKNSLDNIP